MRNGFLFLYNISHEKHIGDYNNAIHCCASGGRIATL